MSKHALAEVVLIAADTFSSMLSAYRGNLQPPAGEELTTTDRFTHAQAGQQRSATSCRRVLPGANTNKS